MQVHHAVSEVEVLTERFTRIQVLAEELTSSPLCPQNTVESVRDLAESVSKMRIGAKETISKKEQEVCQLDQELESLEATSKSCQESWTLKISSIKTQIDEAMRTWSRKEDQLLKVNSNTSSPFQQTV